MYIRIEKKDLGNDAQCQPSSMMSQTKATALFGLRPRTLRTLQQSVGSEAHGAMRAVGDDDEDDHAAQGHPPGP